MKIKFLAGALTSAGPIPPGTEVEWLDEDDARRLVASGAAAEVRPAVPFGGGAARVPESFVPVRSGDDPLPPAAPFEGEGIDGPGSEPALPPSGVPLITPTTREPGAGGRAVAPEQSDPAKSPPAKEGPPEQPKKDQPAKAPPAKAPAKAPRPAAPPPAKDAPKPAAQPDDSAPTPKKEAK